MVTGAGAGGTVDAAAWAFRGVAVAVAGSAARTDPRGPSAVAEGSAEPVADVRPGVVGRPSPYVTAEPIGAGVVARRAHPPGPPTLPTVASPITPTNPTSTVPVDQAVARRRSSRRPESSTKTGRGALRRGSLRARTLHLTDAV